MKYSIVIPTYNHCDDLLKPCIESINKYSHADQIEIIVVANGCTDNTREYVQSLGGNVSMIWSDEALGYTKATNLGIKQAKGKYVVLLNNDTLLLEQPVNYWLERLVAPFADPNVGITGPLQLYDDYSNHDVLIFFCVMIRKTIFDEIGILDEIFTPGGGEDIDFTIRVKLAGYKSVCVCDSEYMHEPGTNVGDFPIWHKNNKTFGEIPEYGNYIIKRNGLINCKRYNKDIKLNIGSGGIEYPGYLSVDLYDPRAQVKMDITKLDFDDNSVSEIMAIHVFEHLNPYKSLSILADWNRVLKPGSKLIMEMPDIEQLCKNFATADYWGKFGILNAIYGSVNTTDSGDPSDITSPHLFGWWPESLYNHLTTAGFTDIKFMPEQIPHPAYNLRVECIKPNTVPDAIEPKKEKDYTVYVISNKPEKFADIVSSLAPEQVQYFDGTGYESFSKLVNQCVASCPTETVIIMSDRVLPKQEHVEKVLKLLDQGYAFVALYRYAFFGFKKELFRRIGMFDERYVGGGFEDYDFTVRLVEADAAMYITEEVPYIPGPSSWNYSKAQPHWVSKWKHIWGSSDVNYPIKLERMMPEEKYSYDLGESVPCKFLPIAGNAYALYSLHIDFVFKTILKTGKRIYDV